jgi:UDP-N-acetylglucosamine 2-epimerase
MRLLDDRAHYSRMSLAHNPFGDGHASERILDILAFEAGTVPSPQPVESRTHAL